MLMEHEIFDMFSRGNILGATRRRPFGPELRVAGCGIP